MSEQELSPPDISASVVLTHAVAVAPSPAIPSEAYEVIAALTSDYLFSYRIEADGTIFPEWFSDAFTRATGYTTEDIRTTGYFAILPEEDRPAAAERLQRLLVGESIVTEHRIITRSGEVRWIRSTCGVLRDESGRITRIVGASRDITEARELEAARAQNEAEIAEINRQLRQAISETHHRVRNNLQAISSLVDLLTMANGDTVPVAEIERLGQHIRSIAAIHEMLIQEARTADPPGTISIRAMLDRLVPILQRALVRRYLRFAVEDARLPVRQGSSLAVVVNELVSNAARHGTGDIELALTVQGENAALEVRDDGPAFPPGFAPRRATQSGLELVENVSRTDLGGETSYESLPEGGVRVRITFPLAQE